MVIGFPRIFAQLSPPSLAFGFFGSLLSNPSSVSFPCVSIQRHLLPLRLRFPTPPPLSVLSPSQLPCLSRCSPFSVNFYLNAIVSPFAVDFYLNGVVFLNGVIFFIDIVLLSNIVVPSLSSLISTDLPPFPLHFLSSALSPPFSIFLPSLSLLFMTINIQQGLLSPLFLNIKFASPLATYLLCLATYPASSSATCLAACSTSSPTVYR
ncbi:hypothetical protein ACLOJK_001338 [Asimina triloba]